MWVKFRHKVFFKLFRNVVLLILRIKYRFYTKKYKLPKGPHLILFNHPTNMDPVFAGVAVNRPTYFIANEDLFNIPYVSKILNYLVAPIPKQKSVKDLSTIRTSLRVVKEGGNIGVSPEGNRTYSGKLNNIDFAITKFIKLLKIPVVLYTIKGGFGVNPRFAVNLRKGKIYGEIARIISKEEVLNLSEEELYKIVVETLDVDDTKLGLKYKGEKLAEYLESAFYICPVCNEFHTLRTEGNHLYCDHCNMSAEYTEDLLFKSTNERFKIKTVRDLATFQDEFIRNYDFESLEFKDDEITLYKTNKGRSRDEILTGSISLDKDYLIIKNEETEIKLKIEEIISLAVLYHNTIIINLKEEKYHLSGNVRFNAVKYLHLFSLLKFKKEGDKDAFLGI